MHRETIALYEREAANYRARRAGSGIERAEALCETTRGGRVLDAGCGPGIYLPSLGAGAVGVDGVGAMLDLAREAAPGKPLVQADLAALPFAARSFGGAWARQSYVHIERSALPAALADLHRALAVDAVIDLTMLSGTGDGWKPPDDDFPGRFFAGWTAAELEDVVVGAGFESLTVTERARTIVVNGRRGRALPDTVGAGMSALICGLNPSVHAADAGVGYAGPGNRFWPAAIEAGLLRRARDPYDALRQGVGMTDLVKRATPRAKAVRPEEFRLGRERVERLVKWLGPGSVCFVGLQGYRAAVDRTATSGWQDRQFGGVPTYVMPSTSALNAATTYDTLVGHLSALAAVATAL